MYANFCYCIFNFAFHSCRKNFYFSLFVIIHLHIPFLSFFSIDKVPKITSPVLVIHGTDDEVIDFSHGLAIYENCPRAVEPLWVEGAGHNDVECYGEYLLRLKNFITMELVN